MALPNNSDLGTLDYEDGGRPISNAPGASDVDTSLLDVEAYGVPLGAGPAAPPSVAIVTQTPAEVLVTRITRARVTQVVKEVLVSVPRFAHVTQLPVEILVRTPPRAVLGKSWNVFQPDQYVDVYLPGGGVSSAADELAVLNGANVILIGYEILQFRDVTNLGDDVYRLSHLLRGRFGTEWAMSQHVANERVVVLTETGLRRVRESTADLDQIRYYKAVSNRQTLQQAAIHAIQNTGASVRPYAPSKVEGSRDGSNNLTITWIRRTRISGEWRDYVDVPIGELTEAYEIDIVDPADGSIKRTIEASSETATYSAADQTMDFGAPQNPMTVRVYQMSDIRGRGYGTQANL